MRCKKASTSSSTRVPTSQHTSLYGSLVSCDLRESRHAVLGVLLDVAVDHHQALKRCHKAYRVANVAVQGKRVTPVSHTPEEMLALLLLPLANGVFIALHVGHPHNLKVGHVLMIWMELKRSPCLLSAHERPLSDAIQPEMEVYSTRVVKLRIDLPRAHA